VGQRGFWDDQQRVAKLQEKKPVLKRLADSIPWESFRPLLDKGYAHERKSHAGRKRIEPYLRSQGLQARGGQSIDATIVPLP
jgi:hypothetical protein